MFYNLLNLKMEDHPPNYQSNYSQEIWHISRKSVITPRRNSRGFGTNTFIPPSYASCGTNSNFIKDPNPSSENNETIKSDLKFNQINHAKQNQIIILRERLEIPNLWKVFRKSSPVQRLIWTFVFLVSLTLFLYETVDRIEKLIDTPKSASVKLAYEEKLEFPAVSVCPGFQFRASILDKFKVDRFGCNSDGEKYCSWDFPWNMATHTETIIKSCKYKKHRNCNPGTEERGKWSRQLTSLGRCFTYVASEHVYGGGDSNAFEIQIDPMLWDRFGIATFSGIRVYVHSPTELPLAEINGININHGSAVHFALQVKEFHRVKDLKNNPCTENLDYIQSKCIMLCVYEATMSAANTSCGAPFMKVFNFKTCRTRKEISYFTSVFQNVVNNGSVWSQCTTECPRPCVQKTYTPITSSLGFTHTNSSMINVTIYFTDMWVERIIEQWDYNIEEFVSDTGGSLNLFLGASFITLIQISDYLLALVCHWLWNAMLKISTLKNKIVRMDEATNVDPVRLAW